MAAADRLSALADDILQRILSFAPVKDAAASAILSRRWRSLWRRTSVLNLDSCPYTCFDAFFRHATAALADRHHGTGFRKLTLVLMEGAFLPGVEEYRLLRLYGVEPEQDVRVAGLLVDPAMAALEVLRIDAYGQFQFYVPPLAFLPCAATTLRVLELQCCHLEPSPPSACLAFPRLTDMTLRNCCYLTGCLQAVVDAAPALTRLTLVDVTNMSPPPPNEPLDMTQSFNLPLRLRCPTVTDFVLVTNMCLEEHNDSRDIGIQLDMPSLRSFRYRGFPVKLSMTSPTPGLERVDFDATARESYEPPARILGNFSSTRALKLHIKNIEDIVADGEEAHSHSGDILRTFPDLKLLEVDGTLDDCHMALAMATLLRSCPAIAELRLKLSNWDFHYHPECPAGSFAQSMERFNRLAPMCSAHRDIVELSGVSELPDAFNNCSFSYLQKVTLQFKSTEFNCFQVQLAKFLVQNAMMLKEMHIEDESQFWTDHIRHKVARWRADAFRRNNLPDTAGFRVY